MEPVHINISSENMNTFFKDNDSNEHISSAGLHHYAVNYGGRISSKRLTDPLWCKVSDIEIYETQLKLRLEKKTHI